MLDDPIVAEVRRIREQLTAALNFDVDAVFDDLRNRQALVGQRLVRQRKHREDEPVQVSDPDGCRASA